MIQLIHGDCLEEMKKIPDGSVDLVLTEDYQRQWGDSFNIKPTFYQCFGDE